ncbi:MAG: RES family NAD+ phosphorylase [Acidobacteriota bacterium]|nr:RES family NAD+ phosphorylase [Acidobacteriota bacterium]
MSDIAALSPDWHTSPPPNEIRLIGDNWIDTAASLVMSVPSAIVPSEKIFLVNATHPDFPTLKITAPNLFPSIHDYSKQF